MGKLRTYCVALLQSAVDTAVLEDLRDAFPGVHGFQVSSVDNRTFYRVLHLVNGHALYIGNDIVGSAHLEREVVSPHFDVRFRGEVPFADVFGLPQPTPEELERRASFGPKKSYVLVKV